jgi:integrase
MGAMKLTDRTVAALACPPGRKDILLFDADLKGFGVRVTAGGRRIWLQQYRVGAKVRRHPIGDWPNVTAAAARKKAEQLRGKTRGGADPVAERRTARAAVLAAEAEVRARKAVDALTVDVLISDWQRLHLAERSRSYRQEAPRRLRAGLASRLTTPAAGLDRAAAVEALDAVKATQGPVAANRVRAYARACFGWAVKRGTILASPFASVPAPAQETSRDRVLSDAELGRLWRASDRLGEPWRGIVRTLMLTGQRRGEVAGMSWRELTPDLSTWTVPAERSKNGRAHDVPLAPAVRDMLRARPRLAGCHLVFWSGRKPRSGVAEATPPSGFGLAKRRLDELLSEPPLPAWTLHDIRRSLATGLQRAGVRLEVTEAVLNHVSGSRSGIVGVYQRHAWTAEKRAALDGWAEHILRIAENPH